MSQPLPADAFAIRIDGNDAVVADNVITTVSASFNAYGIRISGLRGVVSNNVIKAIADGTGPGTGVFLDDASSVYRGNIVLATSVPYSGGTNAGGNYP